MNKVFNKISEDTVRGSRIYESPEIRVINVELEHSIAAGSAKISPKNSSGQVFESWQEDVDDTRTVEW